MRETNQPRADLPFATGTTLSRGHLLARASPPHAHSEPCSAAARDADPAGAGRKDREPERGYAAKGQSPLQRCRLAARLYTDNRYRSVSSRMLHDQWDKWPEKVRGKAPIRCEFAPTPSPRVVALHHPNGNCFDGCQKSVAIPMQTWQQLINKLKSWLSARHAGEVRLSFQWSQAEITIESLRRSGACKRATLRVSNLFYAARRPKVFR